ncbi:MAG: alpha/beta hydrolase [Pseudomonadota bacterium]
MEIASSPVRLVLLPGMDGTGELFEAFIKALGGAYEIDVISYPKQTDLGYGELKFFIESRLQEKPFVLLGESFSGPLAVAVAAEQPAGLRGLILSCTFVRNPRPYLSVFRGLLNLRPAEQISSDWVTTLLGPFLFNQLPGSDLTKMLGHALRQVSPAVMVRRAREVISVDELEKLKLLQVPVMYLQAEQDRVVPPSSAKLIQRKLPNMEIVKIPGPHCLLQASPVLVAQVVQVFCTRLNWSAL